MHLFSVPLHPETCGSSYCAYEDLETQAKHTTDLRASQLIPALKPRVLGGTEELKGNTGLLLPTQVPIHQSVPPTHGLQKVHADDLRVPRKGMKNMQVQTCCAVSCAHEVSNQVY